MKINKPIDRVTIGLLFSRNPAYSVLNQVFLIGFEDVLGVVFRRGLMVTTYVIINSQHPDSGNHSPIDLKTCDV